MLTVAGCELRGNAEPEQLASTPVHQVINPLAPKIERGSFLEVIAVPVVDGRHTRLHVIQNLRHYEAGYASAHMRLAAVFDGPYPPAAEAPVRIS